MIIARGVMAVECEFERAKVRGGDSLALRGRPHAGHLGPRVVESLVKKGQPSRAEIIDAAIGERAECVILKKAPDIVEAVARLDDILLRMQYHQSKKSSRLHGLPVGRVQESTEPN